ncbi:MAG: ABC transporter permease [Ardenticatenaceae bacterium]|nr:ABC transporter permease [Ardenticatenaceae bacterium]
MKRSFSPVAVGVAPVLLALLVTSLIIIIAGAQPLEVFLAIINGSFGTAIKISDTFVVWVSLAICSAGLLVTFRAGQWNIGVEGQIVLGAIGAVWATRLFEGGAPALVISTMLLLGMIAGALWGVLVGLLKIYGGVNEIFGGLGLNFVATSMTIYLISGPWKPEGTSSVSASKLLPNEIWLPTLEGLRVSPVSIVLALIVIVLVFLALRGTIWGLELKAVGQNDRSAFVLGVPTQRILLSAYTVCGICAGLVGAILVAGVRHQLVVNISAGYGFFSILIVLLSGFTAVWSPLIAFFFAALGIGGTALRLGLDLDSSLSGVLQGVLVVSFELVQGIRQKWFGGDN